MNRFHRNSAWAAVAAIAMFGGTIVHATEHGDDAAAVPEGCRKEVWRVDVTSINGNPKYTPLPRFRPRTVLICDDKAFAKIQQR